MADIKIYLVEYYARLVQKKQYDLEKDVPEEYRERVAECIPKLPPIEDEEYLAAINPPAEPQE